MAFDELISAHAAYLQALTANAWARWSSAANKARTSAYTVDDLFEDLRSQFVENWDTWNDVMDLPMQKDLPTVTVQAKWNALTGASNDARVRRRLTNLDFLRPPLEQIGGTGAISTYSAAKTGVFDGSLQITVGQNVTQPTGDHDVYRGLVLASPAGAKRWTPLSWVVVIANKV